MFWEDVPEENKMMGLSKLVGTQSWQLADLLNLSDDDMVWLKLRMDEWHLLPGFRKMEDFVKNLSVTNDCAERGIALVENFIQ